MDVRVACDVPKLHCKPFRCPEPQVPRVAGGDSCPNVAAVGLHHLGHKLEFTILAGHGVEELTAGVG